MNIYQDLYDEVKDLDTKDEILNFILSKSTINNKLAPYGINSTCYKIKNTSDKIDFDKIGFDLNEDRYEFFITILKTNPKIFIANLLFSNFGNKVVGKHIVNNNIKISLSKLKTIYNYIIVNDLHYNFDGDSITIWCLRRKFIEIFIYDIDDISVDIRFSNFPDIEISKTFIEQLNRDLKLEEMMEIFKTL